MGTASKSYDGVAVTVPITIPYTRYSELGATWFIGRALAEMIKAAGIEKADIDGLAMSSFTLAPDSVVALTEHFSMSPRWLEHLPHLLDRT